MSDRTTLAATRPAGIRRLTRSNAFAWIISVALHGALFVAFYQMGFGKSLVTRRVIIPEARLAAGAAPVIPRADAPVRLSPNPGPAGAAPAPRGAAPRLDELAILSVATPAAGNAQVVSAAPPTTLALPGVDVGGTGNALGTTGTGSGATAIGPVSRFFGQAGNAYKVVYVVDLSASIWPYSDQIASEMHDSIRDLLPTQEFHIILAMPLSIRELENKRLVPANSRYKSQAYDLLKIITHRPDAGEADPIAAMKRAFAVQPELIYFLTDGQYQKIESELLTTLKQLNADGHVKITVLGFDPSPATRVLLERIAHDHGGHCRFVE